MSRIKDIIDAGKKADAHTETSAITQDEARQAAVEARDERRNKNHGRKYGSAAFTPRVERQL